MPTRVSLEDANGNFYHQARLDEHAEVAQLIPAIITTLRLPITDETGRPVTYHLAHNERRMQKTETLSSAEVQDGDTLVVVPEMSADNASLLEQTFSSLPYKTTPSYAPFPTIRTGNVSSTILVSLEDIRGSVRQQMKLDADTEVSRLITTILINLELPVRDETGRRLTYHLEHKSRYMRETDTLSRANVQEGDTIVIIPEMITGPKALITVTSSTPSIIVPPGFTLYNTFQGHTGAINQVVWSPDGKILASSSEDHTIRLWQGTDCITLQGHSHGINSIAWSPTGDMLASGSSDNTIRIWNPNTGAFIRSIDRYVGSVNSVAWSPVGDMLAAGYSDNIIRIWNPNTGGFILRLKEHTSSINSVAWSPVGDMLAAGSSDNTIRIWSTQTWQRLQLHEAHIGEVYSVAWSPDGKTLVSASQDSTICIWNIQSGKKNRTLEVQSLGVSYVSFSSDGRFLVSLTNTGTVQIWRSDVWDIVATFNEGSSNSTLGIIGKRFMGTTFHPKALTLATPDTSNQTINVWELDISFLLKPLITTSMHYANAKVVLLGDSGVGKTGLGLVLIGKSFVPTESTHGRQVWLFDSTEANVQDEHTETHEILLWDLAGQLGYRPIHQFHLNEVAIALVVFNAHSETDPFAGVRYWHRALRQVQQMQNGARLPIKKFLVAARTDRNGISVSQERIMRLLQELGFDGYFETSAKNGKNILVLIERIKQEIDWNALPRVSSTSLFQQIKTFLLAEKKTGRLLSSVDDLYRAFLKFDKTPIETEEPQAQFEKCIGRIETQGLLQRLSFGNLILLQPELLDSYASTLMRVVKDEPDGFGSIAEEEVRTGTFAVSEDYRLKDREQEKLLLIAMIDDLLRHEIALREHLSDGTCLIFPSEATRENPDLPNPEGKTVIFNFEGPVIHIYDRLVVRLAHSDFFKKKDLWKNAVTYTARRGGTCGLFLSGNSDEGRGELTLFFEETVSEETQFDFEDYIQTHLQRWALPDSIKRKRIFVCPNPECETLFTEAQVTRRRKRGFTTIICSVCDTEVSLLDKEERLNKTPTSAIKKMDAAADSQREYEAAQSTLEGKRATNDFDVFLCHHGIDKAKVKEIGKRLEKRGFLPWLDEYELQPGIPWQRSLEKQIGQIKSAAIFIGENGIGPWQEDELDAFLREFKRRRCPVIPLLLDDAPLEPKLPIFLQGMTWVDFRKKDPDPMEQLIWGITGKNSRLGGE